MDNSPEKASGAIPSFIKIGSGIQKLMGEGDHRHTNNMMIS
jgi:hypothetical protein